MTRTTATTLWTIVAVFAAFNVTTTLFPTVVTAGLVGIVNTTLLVAFALVHGGITYGIKGIGIFLVVCLVVGNFGVPFTNLGWLFTVFIFFSIFRRTLYARLSRAFW